MKFLDNPKIRKYKYGIITSLVIIVSVFWDLFFKIITDGFTVTIIPNFFWLESSHNYGAAYGIFSGQTILLIIISIIMLGLIFAYNWFHKKKTILYCVSLGLICGGAVGNLLDRIFLGYVRDFIRFSLFNFNFNIADACLTIGVIMFAVYLIFYDDLFKKIKFKKQTSTTEESDNTTNEQQIEDSTEVQQPETLTEEKQEENLSKTKDDINTNENVNQEVVQEEKQEDHDPKENLQDDDLKNKAGQDE